MQTSVKIVIKKTGGGMGKKIHTQTSSMIEGRPNT